MIFRGLIGKRKGKNGNGQVGPFQKTALDIEHLALFQISSAIRNQREIPTIFEIIGRESARCLRANRSTVFLLEEPRGVLKKYSYSPQAIDETLGLLEEKEIARRSITEKRPVLLKTPEDFSEFFMYQERERKITSLLSSPFGYQGKICGALSVSLINQERAFTEKDLQFLCVFANHASIALQNNYLVDEIRRGSYLRKSYEEYLDDFLNQLQSLSAEERRRIDEHIGRFLSGMKESQPAGPNRMAEEPPGKDTIRMTGEARFEDAPPHLTEKVQVEVENYLAAGEDLGRAGIFIPTANPRELGERFTLRLYVSPGEPVEVPAKVIFSNKYGKESHNLRRGMGIKFLELPPESQEKLKSHIQSLRRPAPAPSRDRRFTAENAESAEQFQSN